MLISYRSCDEVIVCKKKDEKDALVTYFGPGLGRDLEDYDRTEHADTAVMVSTRFMVD